MLEPLSRWLGQDRHPLQPLVVRRHPARLPVLGVRRRRRLRGRLEAQRSPTTREQLGEQLREMDVDGAEDSFEAPSRLGLEAADQVADLGRRHREIVAPGPQPAHPVR